MDKRRLLIGLLILIAIPLYVWIQYYEIPSKAKVGESNRQQDPLTHDFAQVLSLKSQYMGDASNTSGLFQSLPLSEMKGPIEMDSEALSVTVHYEAAAEELGDKAEQAVLYNTTAAFVLIQNVEQVNMQFTDRSFTVTRENVKEWYGQDLSRLLEPESFQKVVQQPLQNDDLKKWLASYTKGE
ncbi:DUF4825 domain-containing protein [Sporosarcina sp. 179-K 3D1 HS]|uniref:DUF4825 domain-containing protein n=1 Tax=Sporosarcina sp. 179-K 3D1 HS TaxID=3232169 RepID=UPI00399F2F2C